MKRACNLFLVDDNYYERVTSNAIENLKLK